MKKWLLLAVVGLMSACSKSDIEEVNTSIGAESPIFYASLEGSDETRTYLDANQKMRWTTDDRVTIFFGENYNREFAFTGETGSTAGSFNQKSTDGFYTAEKVTANYAVYPHQASTQLEVEGYFKLSLPATQSYAEDSFGLNANTMVAVTKTVDDRFLQFKNVCGYLKLNLYGAKVTVKRITLTGNNEEPLAGAATVTPTYGGDPSMAWAASGTTTSLTLDCGDGVKIGATEAEATPFWLVVPPTTFTKGFTVTITDTAGNTFTKSSTSKQTITRNISKNMPAFEIAPTGPANNEIWYTSTDGKIVTPNRTDAFGAKITSNIYENGKGVITFDGPVTEVGSGAFYGYTLTSITFPESVTTIAVQAITEHHGTLESFGGKFATEDGRCLIVDGKLVAFASAGLTEYMLPETVTIIGSSAFESSGIANVEIPNSVVAIEPGAFLWSGLTSVVIPGSVKTLGNTAFTMSRNLAEVVFSEGVKTVELRAFYGCSKLAKVTIPASMTAIHDYAFAETALTSVTFPEQFSLLGWNAFATCAELAAVYCKAVTPPVTAAEGWYDWFDENAEGRKIYVPAESVAAYKAADGWSEYADAIVGYDFETGTIIADTGITDNSLDSSKYLVYVGNHSTAFAVTSSRDYNVWETYFEHSASGFSVAEYKFQLPEITTAWTPISDDDITIKGSVIRVYNGSRYNNNDDRVPVYTSFDLSTIDVDPTSVITLRIDDANDVVTINGKEMKGAIETAMSKYIYSSYYYEYDEGAYRQYDGIGEGTKLYYAKGWDEYGRLKYLGYASKAINPDTANEEACWKSQCYTNNSIEEKETFANNRYLSGEYIPLGMGNL